MNTSISPDYTPFPPHGLSCLQRQVNQIHHSRPIIGMKQILESLLSSAKSARRQTIHRLKFRRPGIDSGPNIPLKSSYASGLLCQSQPFLAVAQRLFRALAVTYVRDNEEKACFVSDFN